MQGRLLFSLKFDYKCLFMY